MTMPGEPLPSRAKGAAGNEQAEPSWFRAPTRRERWIAAGLFGAFGLFFVLLFIVQRGWWFRWVVLALAIVSAVYALRQGLSGDGKTSER